MVSPSTPARGIVLGGPGTVECVLLVETLGTEAV